MNGQTFLKPRQILNQLPKQDDWYRIVNKAAEDRAEVYLYDEIGIWGTTAGNFIREIKEISAREIALHISSRGGDIFDGIAIYNALRTHSARVVVQVDSMAASIASVIAQAGDERIMITGSQMMIHEAWGIALGNAEDMRAYAEVLDKQTEIIASIYAERSGGTGRKAHYLKLMRAETWMTAEEAVDELLADRVVKPESQDSPEPSGTVSEDDENIEEKAAARWADDFLASTEIEFEELTR